MNKKVRTSIRALKMDILSALTCSLLLHTSISFAQMPPPAPSAVKVQQSPPVVPASPSVVLSQVPSPVKPSTPIPAMPPPPPSPTLAAVPPGDTGECQCPVNFGGTSFINFEEFDESSSLTLNSVNDEGETEIPSRLVAEGESDYSASGDTNGGDEADDEDGGYVFVNATLAKFGKWSNWRQVWHHNTHHYTRAYWPSYKWDYEAEYDCRTVATTATYQAICPKTKQAINCTTALPSRNYEWAVDVKSDDVVPRSTITRDKLWDHVPKDKDGKYLQQVNMRVRAIWTSGPDKDKEVPNFIIDTSEQNTGRVKVKVEKGLESS